MRNNVYGTYDEKYVKSVIVYAIDGVLYYDAEGKEAVEKKDVSDLFFKGVRVNVDGSVYDPISCTANDGDEYATLAVRKADCISIYGSKDAPAFEDVTFGIKDITQLTVGYVFEKDSVLYFPCTESYGSELETNGFNVSFSVPVIGTPPPTNGTLKEITLSTAHYSTDDRTYTGLNYLEHFWNTTKNTEKNHISVWSTGNWNNTLPKTAEDSVLVIPAGSRVQTASFGALKPGSILIAELPPAECVSKDIKDLKVGDMMGPGCVLYLPNTCDFSGEHSTGVAVQFSNGTVLYAEQGEMSVSLKIKRYGETTGTTLYNMGSWYTSGENKSESTSYYKLPVGTTVVSVDPNVLPEYGEAVVSKVRVTQ